MALASGDQAARSGESRRAGRSLSIPTCWHQLAGYNLLIIDQLHYVPLSLSGAELLLEVFSRPNQGCQEYRSSRNSVPTVFSSLVVQHRSTLLAAPTPATGTSGAQHIHDPSAERHGDWVVSTSLAVQIRQADSRRVNVGRRSALSGLAERRWPFDAPDRS